MYIRKVSEATEELHAALQRLVPQLGFYKIPPTWEELNKLITSGSSILCILCLTIYRVPTGLRSIIEDVIVDKDARRQGMGEALMRYAIDLAREMGADGVSLTSNPKREAANALYRSMGFELRHTNPYFYKIK